MLAPGTTAVVCAGGGVLRGPGRTGRGDRARGPGRRRGGRDSPVQFDFDMLATAVSAVRGGARLRGHQRGRHLPHARSAAARGRGDAGGRGHRRPGHPRGGGQAARAHRRPSGRPGARRLHGGGGPAVDRRSPGPASGRALRPRALGSDARARGTRPPSSEPDDRCPRSGRRRRTPAVVVSPARGPGATAALAAPRRQRRSVAVMPPNDGLQRYLEAGLALTQITRARAEELVHELIQAGEVETTRAQDWVEDLVKTSRERSDTLAVDRARRSPQPAGRHGDHDHGRPGQPRGRDARPGRDGGPPGHQPGPGPRPRPAARGVRHQGQEGPGAQDHRPRRPRPRARRRRRPRTRRRKAHQGQEGAGQEGGGAKKTGRLRSVDGQPRRAADSTQPSAAGSISSWCGGVSCPSRSRTRTMPWPGVRSSSAGSVADKPSRLVAESDAIVVDSGGRRFVSRGGDKLEAALDRFAVAVAGRRCLDAGASTGGFTDCLLATGRRPRDGRRRRLRPTPSPAP